MSFAISGQGVSSTPFESRPSVPRTGPGEDSSTQQNRKSNQSQNTGPVNPDRGKFPTENETRERPKLTGQTDSDQKQSSGEKSPELLPENKPENRKPSGEELSRREKREVEKLKRRDREVRRHEQAHLAAGGRHVRGGMDLEFKRGPNGERFAVGGSVDLDVGREESPEKTIQKMRQVRAAALAPSQPSPKDLQVAQSASRKETEARKELSEEQQEELKETQEKIRDQQSDDKNTEDSEKTGEQAVRDIGGPTARQINGNSEQAEDRSSPAQGEPSSFRDPSEEPVNPEIDDSINPIVPEIEDLESQSVRSNSDSNSRGESNISAPSEAFESSNSASATNTMTLGGNIDTKV